MHNVKVLTVVALLAALPLAGCIENMDDLRDRLQGTSQELDQTGKALDNASKAIEDAMNRTANATVREYKPPVARISVFAGNGALVYRASFIAENQTEPILLDGGMATFNAADSEVIQPGAELATFEWSINGKTMDGRKVESDLTEPGLYMITLTVTDTFGTTDSQMIHLGVMPKPFDEVLEFTGGPIGGAEAEALAAITSGSHTFSVLSEIDGKKVKATAMTVVADGGSTHDEILVVTDPSGTSQSKDAGTPTETESMVFSDVAPGDWTATIDTYAGASLEYTITVTITYIQIVEGLGDGHAHAH